MSLFKDSNDKQVFSSEPQPQPEVRSFLDVPTIRKNLFGNVQEAITKKYPIENDNYALELSNLRYDASAYGIKDSNIDWANFHIPKKLQKDTLLKRGTLDIPLKGTWALRDKLTNQIISQNDKVVARVPYMTERGTFIFRGNEYVTSHQQRLRPGVYTRVKENGEIEAHANLLPGTGSSFRMFMEPETGIFKFRLGQGTFPAYPVFKALGVNDATLRETWGDKILALNMAKASKSDIQSFMERIADYKTKKQFAAAPEQGIAAAFAKMKIDPEVSQRTLGKPYEAINTESLLRTTQKLLNINLKKEEVDDRDSQANLVTLGPEDIFAERIAKDAGSLSRNLLWKVTNKKTTQNIPSAYLTKQVNSALLNSGLSSALSEINPAEILDQINKVTRMGEGGLTSLDAIPDSARSVQPSQLGYIDVLRSPESSRIGVDTRAVYDVLKGKDGKLYRKLLNPKTNKYDLVNASTASEKTIAFPGEFDKDNKKIYALRNGKIVTAGRDEIDYILPSGANMFSHLANIISSIGGSKGQRVNMGSRMTTQALPLDISARESPLVQSMAPDDQNFGTSDKSFESLLGKYMGNVYCNLPKGGIVKEITPDEIKVLDPISKKIHSIDIYNNFPLNQKSAINSTPLVKVGDQIKPGQLLAHSNFTDKNGVTALGTNLRIGYLPFEGNYEDAVVISESAAKKLSSEHMYVTKLEKESDELKLGKKSFLANYPSLYTKDQLEKLGDDGVIKPGQIVNQNDPLVIGTRMRKPEKGQGLFKASKSWLTKYVETWDHEAPGVVTDVFHDDEGVKVAVKSVVASKIGDKLCYSEDTEVLTSNGWKLCKDITLLDEVCSLDPITNNIEYINPVELHNYSHNERMYSVQSTQVDLCVTDNHHLYAKLRNKDNFELIEAKDLFGKRYKLQRNGNWQGTSPVTVTLKGVEVKAGQHGNGSRTLDDIQLPTDTYLMLLGMFLSEGNVFCHEDSGSFGIDITQIKEPNRSQLLEALTAAGISFNEFSDNTKVRLYGKVLYEHFKQFGKSLDKFIPNEVFNWDKQDLLVLFKWMMWGDGSTKGDAYFTCSYQLAQDVQRLCLHLGWSANVTKRHDANIQTIKGKQYNCAAAYRVAIYKKKNTPEINHGHTSTQSAQTEQWIDYSGNVYCVTLPKNHILYVRRNGKPVWCGNSGRYGNKGVISRILPDDQMPRTGDKPLEVVFNPLGLISRVNPAMLAEVALSKIARKTGKPYIMQSFSKEPLVDYVLNELKKHNIPETEEVFDPTTNRKLKDIMTGEQFIMKLHHVSESKESARDAGVYTLEGAPAKGQAGQAKRVGGLEMNALVAHNVPAVIRDIKLVRGTKNDDFWRKFRMGLPAGVDDHPFVYDKFLNMLSAAGIRVNRKPNSLHLMAMSNKDIDELAGDRELENADTINIKNGEPIPGGLFDLRLTGGKDNKNRWAKITLQEPLPNPLMEEPIRRVLGMTGPAFHEMLFAEQGPQKVSKLLNDINIDDEINKAIKDIKSERVSKRDDAIKRLQYLKAAKDNGLHPRDWMIKAVPVLPPAFRPVVAFKDMELTSDSNILYKELFEANKNLKDLKGSISDLKDERAALYYSLKAVTGLGDPISQKSQEKNVAGMLTHIFGKSSPKFGMFQNKLISTTVDSVGRAAIIPDSTLDLDEVGIPENIAWEVYKPHIMRKLSKKYNAGNVKVPLTELAQWVADRDPRAKEALINELKERPVIISRAPVLHKFGIMGAKPVLVNGNNIRIPPLTTPGYGADFDGDLELTLTLIGIKRTDSNKTFETNQYQGNILLEDSVLKTIDNRTLIDYTYLNERKVEISMAMKNALGIMSDEYEFFAINLEDFPYEQLIGTKEGKAGRIDFFTVPEGFKVVALDEKTGNPVLADIAGWSIHYDREIELVNLKNGNQIITDNDPRGVYGVDPATMEYGRWTPTDALAKKVFVPVVARSTHILDEVKTNTAITIKHKETGNKLKDSVELTYSFGHLLGMLIGDGWVSFADDIARGVCLAASESELADAFKQELPTILNWSGNAKTLTETTTDIHIKHQFNDTDKLPGSTGSHKYTVNSSALAEVVLPWIGKGAHHKHLPPFIWSAPKEFKEGVIAGIFDTDGGVSFSNGKKKPQIMINLTSVSIRLVQELQFLFKTIGIQSTVTTSNTPNKDKCYVLNVSTVDWFNYGGFKLQHANKAANQSRVLNDSSLMPIEHTGYMVHNAAPFNSVIYVAFKQFISSKENKRDYYAIADAKDRGFISKTVARRLMATYRVTTDNPIFTRWVNLVNSDTVFSQVESVEKTGITETGYDLTVPGYETFMAMDGTVLSNTMNIHVPTSQEAIKEVYDKLLPSKNLLSENDYKVHILPRQEFLLGLYLATRGTDKNKEAKQFSSKQEAIKAFFDGKLNLNDPISILG